MKAIKVAVFVLTLLVSLNVYADSFQSTNLDYQVCFTPGGNCTQDVVNAIGDAKKQILVQAYSFTSAPIARALMMAHERGVDVKVILDKSQKTQKYSSATFLANQNIPTWIDYKVAIAHNKVMIIDGNTVITGSFNFTSAAQNKNAENLLILRNDKMAKVYTANWYSRLAQSMPSANYVHTNKHKKERYF
jgi:phosphatidylserine/phosphatidylglycerophosphate/cardiolipin synthase-like enzyme